MKVIIVSSEFPPGPGGIADHAYNLAEQLVEKKCDVTVITEYRKEFEVQWRGLRSHAKVKYARRGRWFSNLSFVFLFIRYFITTRNAVWIGTGSKSLALLGVGIYLSRRRSLAILHGHEMLEEHGLKSKLSKRTLQYFTKAIAVSGFSKENSKKFIAESKIVVIPNGFNQTKYASVQGAKERKQPTPLSLLTVGRVSKRKGQHHVVHALPLTLKNHPSALYHIVGIHEGTDLNSLVARLHLQDHVRMHGVLADAELAPLFRHADIFMMLSENMEDGDVEGFGIAILEANFFGTPAIGSVGCGIEQAIKEGFNGKLVPASDPVSIAAAIEEILANYSLYSSNATLWSHDHFWTTIINRYMDVLSSLES